jgi:hypothetical protein
MNPTMLEMGILTAVSGLRARLANKEYGPDCVHRSAHHRFCPIRPNPKPRRTKEPGKRHFESTTSASSCCRPFRRPPWPVNVSIFVPQRCPNETFSGHLSATRRNTRIWKNPYFVKVFWSCRWDLNPWSPHYQCGALPLSYGSPAMTACRTQPAVAFSGEQSAPRTGHTSLFRLAGRGCRVRHTRQTQNRQPHPAPSPSARKTR